MHNPVSALMRRGEALAGLHRNAEAEAELRRAQETALVQGARPKLWRIHLSLGKLYLAQKHREDAEREFAIARALIGELSANIPEDKVRSTFLERATKLFPPARLY